MKTKSKILHPNKLVQQHDEYLIDKSLVNRVKSAKTTIKNSNTFFETRLKSLLFYILLFIFFLFQAETKAEQLLLESSFLIMTQTPWISKRIIN